MGIQRDYYSADGAAGLAVWQFFAGVTPDQTQFEKLTSFVAVQETYYASRGVGDPQLAGYEAIGRAFAADASFTERLSLGTGATTFFTETYSSVFGHAGTTEQVQHFVDQENYFKQIYRSAGLSEIEAAAQARGAAIGQLVGFAVQDASTPYGIGVASFYGDAADGNFTYGKSLDAYSAAPPPAPGHDIEYVLNGTLDIT
jgi:hypothetical protein